MDKSPLKRLKSELLEGQQSVATTLSALIGARVESERGTQKGFKFEDDVLDVLAPATRMFGDTIEYVGDKPNGTNGAGDFIITMLDPRLSSQKKIVVEAKDYKSITLRRLTKNVSDAIDNRNCDAGIGVVRNCIALPKKTGCFSEVSQDISVCNYEDDGTVLVATYRLMRSDLITRDMLENQDGETDQIDVVAIQEAKKTIVTELRDIQIIKSKLTQICSTSNEIEGMVSKIKKTILDNLETIEEAINGEEEE